MDDIVIRARNLSKRYLVFDSPGMRLRHALFGARAASGVREVMALSDVSFEVRRGEAVAVIGRNGGGKSTLLEIITGTLKPTAGEVEVRGRVSALLELGSGFNPEFSGRDNVILNGMLLGLSRSEIERRFDEIAAFADIGDVLDRPVKTYSSGMMMRLAFAVQVLSDPEILIVDEALSVGDFFFQQKCLGYIRSLREKGVTLLFVSHDMSTVRDLCDRAVYLRRGHLAYAGTAGTAITRYYAEQPFGALLAHAGDSQGIGVIQDDLRDAISHDAVWRAHSDKSGPAILAVAIYDEAGNPCMGFRMGTAMHLRVLYRLADEATHVSVSVGNKYDQILCVLGTYPLGLTPLAATHVGQMAVCDLSIQLMIEAGSYSLEVGLGTRVAANMGVKLDSTGAFGPIAVRWDYENETAPFLGMVGLPCKAEILVVTDGSG
jgi:lipopolysaccharide transport system ATP-binding protein